MVSQKALKSLWNLPLNKPYLNNLYHTETKLAREKDGHTFHSLQIFI